MPTSRAGNSRAADRQRARPGEAGFTLVEMLAVMVILALALGAVVVEMRGAGVKPLRALAGETAAKLRDARALAIEQGREEVVVVDLAKGLIGRPGEGNALAIDPGTRVEITGAASEREGRDVAGVRFFPNGASTGGTIRLERGGEAHEVRVNWFTGRITVEPVPHGR